MRSQLQKRKPILWRGSFRYSHELKIIYTRAPSKASAKMRMINQLAKEHDVHPSHVYSVFDGSIDNHLIEEVKE